MNNKLAKFCTIYNVIILLIFTIVPIQILYTAIGVIVDHSTKFPITFMALYSICIFELFSLVYLFLYLVSKFKQKLLN